MTKDISHSKENQWFLENERTLLELARKEREKRLEAYRIECEKAEREKRRLAHWKKCPQCGMDMKAEQLDGIEVDRCTICAGVFFDHGELESLLMRKTENRFPFFRRLFGLD